MLREISGEVHLFPKELLVYAFVSGKSELSEVPILNEIDLPSY